MRYNTTYSNFQIHPQSYQKQWLSHACRMQHVFELRVVHVVHESSARFPWTWLDCSSCWKFKLADNQILFRNMWVSPSWLRREKDFEGRKDTIREAIFEEVFVVSPVWAYIYGNISPAQTSLAWFEQELPFLLRMRAHLKPGKKTMENLSQSTIDPRKEESEEEEDDEAEAGEFQSRLFGLQNLCCFTKCMCHISTLGVSI